MACLVQHYQPNQPNFILSQRISQYLCVLQLQQQVQICISLDAAIEIQQENAKGHYQTLG